jgi:hypothetical protein
MGANLEVIVGFELILYGGDDVEDDTDSMLLNLVAYTIPKWRTFKLLRWVQGNPLIIS